MMTYNQIKQEIEQFIYKLERNKVMEVKFERYFRNPSDNNKMNLLEYLSKNVLNEIYFNKQFEEIILFVFGYIATKIPNNGNKIGEIQNIDDSFAVKYANFVKHNKIDDQDKYKNQMNRFLQKNNYLSAIQFLRTNILYNITDNFNYANLVVSLNNFNSERKMNIGNDFYKNLYENL